MIHNYLSFMRKRNYFDDCDCYYMFNIKRTSIATTLPADNAVRQRIAVTRQSTIVVATIVSLKQSHASMCRFDFARVTLHLSLLLLLRGSYFARHAPITIYDGHRGLFRPMSASRM